MQVDDEFGSGDEVEVGEDKDISSVTDLSEGDISFSREFGYGHEGEDSSDMTTEIPEISDETTTNPYDPMSADDGLLVMNVPTIPRGRKRKKSTEERRLSALSTIDYGGVHCFMLQRLSKYHQGFEKIGMCLLNSNSRHALLFARIGQRLFQDIVDLPFDAERMVGRYRIDWLPTGITWNANNQPIGSLAEGDFPIPSGSFRMKFYGAPLYPEEAPDDFLLEQTMQLYSVQYKSEVTKDELRLVIEPQDKRYIYTLVGIIFIIFAGYVILCHCKMKNHIPDGYETLPEGTSV